VRDYFTMHLFLYEFSEFHLKQAAEVARIARQHYKKGRLSDAKSQPLFIMVARPKDYYSKESI
jgi:hypothetical protein